MYIFSRYRLLNDCSESWCVLLEAIRCSFTMLRLLSVSLKFFSISSSLSFKSALNSFWPCCSPRISQTLLLNEKKYYFFYCYFVVSHPLPLFAIHFINFIHSVGFLNFLHYPVWGLYEIFKLSLDWSITNIVYTSGFTKMLPEYPKIWKFFPNLTQKSQEILTQRHKCIVWVALVSGLYIYMIINGQK